MKTGRLLKFQQGDREIHAYLYRLGAQYRANIYLRPFDSAGTDQSATTLHAASEAELEDAVRAWVSELDSGSS